MNNFCFSQENRVRKSREFRLISNRGGTLKSRFFIILYLQSNHAKLGITVSKKCSKKAVHRNRLKRMIRESFRLNYSNIPAYHIVIIARKSGVTAEHADLFKDLDVIWQKLARFHKKA